MMMFFYPWSNILLPRKTRLESWIKTAGWHEETQIPGKNGISTKQGLLWLNEFTQLFSLHIYARDSQLLVVHMKLCSLSLCVSYRWDLQRCRQLLGLRHAWQEQKRQLKRRAWIDLWSVVCEEGMCPVDCQHQRRNPQQKMLPQNKTSVSVFTSSRMMLFNVTLTKAFWRLAQVVVLPQLLSFSLHLKRKKPLIWRSKRRVKAGSPHLQ